MRKAALLGCVSSPTSSDEPAPGRGEGKCGGSHLPGKHLGPPRLRGSGLRWASGPGSLRALAAPRGQWGHRSCPSQRGPSHCHGNQGKGVVRHRDTAVTLILLPRGPAGTWARAPEAREGASHPTGSHHPPAQRCRSPAEAFHTLLEGADLPPPGPGAPQLGRSGHSSRDRKSGSQVGAYAGVGPALEVLCPFLQRPLTSPNLTDQETEAQRGQCLAQGHTA